MSKKGSRQKEAPLFQAAQKVQQGGYIPFHVPFHGRGAGAPHLLQHGLGPSLQWDFTEISPLDDLHQPAGAIEQAQRLAAHLFGARKTYFLINGATVGLLALFLAYTRPGDKVLLSRFSHKAALHGLVLSGARPVYLPVEYDPGTGLPLNVSPDTVEKALQEHPQARMLLITSPSYWGIPADLQAMGELARNKKMIFAVDEAHGAHFPFLKEKHPHAAAAKADVWIHSAHKSLGALTPGAYLHLGHGHQPAASLPFWLQVLQTSSPPYPVMVSLDLARRQAALQGKRLLKKTRDWALGFRKDLLQRGVPVFVPGAPCKKGFRPDPCRVTVECRGGGGRLLGYLLSRKYRIKIEIEEDYYLLMVVGPALLQYTPQRLARKLARAFQEAGDFFPAGPQQEKAGPVLPFLHQKGTSLPEKASLDLAEAMPGQENLAFPPFPLSPREALQAGGDYILLESSAGQIAGELVVLSPPGIPVFSPGEVITPGAVDYLLARRKAGAVFHGVSDPGLHKIKVVTEVNNIW